MNECEGNNCKDQATWRLKSKGQGLVKGHDVVVLLCNECRDLAGPQLSGTWIHQRIEGPKEAK